MYKKLKNYSINHETEVNFHGFNNRIFRTIENLSITEVVSNSYLYEVDQKTKKGVRITYFPKIIQISIFPSSNKYDYKLADVLLNYLAFYSDGTFSVVTSKSKNSPPYDDKMKNDNRGYFIVPTALELNRDND